MPTSDDYLVAGLAVEPNILRVAAATVAALAVGTAVRLAALQVSPDSAPARRASLKTWWAVAAVILAAAILGRAVAVVLFMAVSAIALHEFFVLRRSEIDQRRLRLLAYGLVPLSYLWIGLNWPGAFFAFLPLAALLALGIGTVLSGRTSGYARAAGQTYWGLLLTAYAPAYAVLLFTLPPQSNPVAGGAGWFLFLLLLTETNDIAQALVGRRLGKRKIARRVSPRKTWAGFVGGVVLTTLLAALLAAWLTPWPPLAAMAAGMVISITGFFGDLNISAIKRDCGVKESSRLLPGQGGMLDRIDSLTFTAPTFYGFVLLMDPASKLFGG